MPWMNVSMPSLVRERTSRWPNSLNGCSIRLPEPSVRPPYSRCQISDSVGLAIGCKSSNGVTFAADWKLKNTRRKPSSTRQICCAPHGLGCSTENPVTDAICPTISVPVRMVTFCGVDCATAAEGTVGRTNASSNIDNMGRVTGMALWSHGRICNTPISLWFNTVLAPANNYSCVATPKIKPVVYYIAA